MHDCPIILLCHVVNWAHHSKPSDSPAPQLFLQLRVYRESILYAHMIDHDGCSCHKNSQAQARTAVNSLRDKQRYSAERSTRGMLPGEALTYIPRKAIVPVSRSGGCHFLLTYRSASCAQYTEHIRIKNIVVVLHIVTKQSSKFELYAGKGGQAMSLTKLVSQGAVDNCTAYRSCSTIAGPHLHSAM